MREGRSRAGKRPSRADSLLPAANSELISGANHLAVGDGQLELFFALHLAAGLVLESGHDLPGCHVDDLSGGGVGGAAVKAEADPSDAVPRLDAGDLLRRHYRR